MKFIYQNLSICLILICAILLVSCGDAYMANKEDECLQPVEKLAYPSGAPASPDEKLSEKSPLGNWQFQAALPERSKVESVSQIIAKSNEIWVMPLDGEKIFRYSIDVSEWKEYNTISNLPVVPRILLLTSDETLWGGGTIAEDANSQEGISLLSRYNEATDQFEFVRDVDGLFDDVLIAPPPMKFPEDEMGRFWFFGSLPGGDEIILYSFNPSTRKAEMHLSLPAGLIYTDPVITKNDVIWFYQGGSERKLLKYFIATNRLEQYNGSPNFNEIGHVSLLFVDNNGNLWFENKGWLDFTDPEEQVWYEMMPSPVFLTDKGWFFSNPESLPTRYGWSVPTDISQSSNGWFWFSTLHGTIRLDPVAEEWCLFTNGNSPVVEGDNGDLWLVVFGKLYRYRTTS